MFLVLVLHLLVTQKTGHIIYNTLSHSAPLVMLPQLRIHFHGARIDSLQNHGPYEVSARSKPQLQAHKYNLKTLKSYQNIRQSDWHHRITPDIKVPPRYYPKNDGYRFDQVKRTELPHRLKHTQNLKYPNRSPYYLRNESSLHGREGQTTHTHDLLNQGICYHILLAWMIEKRDSQSFRRSIH